jgi:outer membrane protein assembly factor BamB
VVDDVLVVPAAGALVALDTEDGSERWRVETPDRVAVVATEHGVYALSGARDGPPSLVARDVSDGRRRWEVGLGDPSETTLLATPDAVVVPTGTRFPRPWVFDPATGESLLPKPDESGHHFHGVRYALDGVAYATDPFYGSVSAHTVSGGGYDSRWRAAFDGPGGKRVAGDPDRLYGAVRSEPRGVHALSTADGSTVWEADGVDELRSRPVVAAGAVLVRTATGLRCLDPTDGSERWARSAEGVGDRVVVADDLVYTTRGGTLRALRPP